MKNILTFVLLTGVALSQISCKKGEAFDWLEPAPVSCQDVTGPVEIRIQRANLTQGKDGFIEFALFNMCSHSQLEHVQFQQGSTIIDIKPAVQENKNQLPLYIVTLGAGTLTGFNLDLPIAMIVFTTSDSDSPRMGQLQFSAKS